MKLYLNDRVVDMFKDTEIKGGYKPISVDSDNLTTNPHSYEFQIPLTENNSDILGFNHSTFDFESEDITAMLYDYDGNLVLSGYAYVNDITIEKLGEQVSVQIVDFFTYILKKYKSKNIGELFKDDKDKRYFNVNKTSISGDGTVSYVWADTCGYEAFRSQFGGNFCWTGGIDAKGQLPMAIRPVNYIEKLGAKHGFDITFDSSLSELNTVLTIIPIKYFASAKPKTTSAISYLNKSFASNISLFDCIPECNLKSDITTAVSILDNEGSLDEYRFFSNIDSKLRKTYNVNAIPYYVGKQDLSLKMMYGLNVKGGELPITTTGGDVNVAICVGGEYYNIGSGRLGVNGELTLSIGLNSERKEDESLYMQPAKIEAGNDIQARMVLMAINPITITAGGRKFVFSGDVITEEGTTDYTSVVAFSVKNTSSTTSFEIEVNDIALNDDDFYELCGAFDVDDRGFYKDTDGYYSFSDMSSYDPTDYSINIADIAETINSAAISVESYIKDFFNRFNLKAIVNGQKSILITNGSLSENKKYIELDGFLDGDISVTKNGSDNSIEYFQIKNADGKSVKDKYSNGISTGSSEKIYIDELSKENKEVSLNSCIHQNELFKDYTSSSNTDVLEEYANIPPILGVPVYENIARSDYGLRYGFLDNTVMVCQVLTQKVGVLLEEFLYGKDGLVFIETNSKLKKSGTANVREMMILTYPYEQSVTMQNASSTVTNGYISLVCKYDNSYTNALNKRHITIGTVSSGGTTFSANVSTTGRATVKRRMSILELDLTSTVVEFIDYCDYTATKNSTAYTVEFNPHWDADYTDEKGRLVSNVVMEIYLPLDFDTTDDYKEPKSCYLLEDYTNGWIYQAFPKMSMFSSSNTGKKISLSFNDKDDTTGEYVNALDYYFGKIINNVYSSKAIFIEGDFYLSQSKISALLSGSEFSYMNNKWFLVEASNINYSSKNGSIVKLKLAKIWE
jgi:hypothetical protein